MTGLDTNILARYLTQDDARQAAQASEEIEGAAGRGEKLLIQPLVLCELISRITISATPTRRLAPT